MSILREWEMGESAAAFVIAGLTRQSIISLKDSSENDGCAGQARA
jgi:hypothetical protein